MSHLMTAGGVLLHERQVVDTDRPLVLEVAQSRGEVPGEAVPGDVMTATSIRPTVSAVSVSGIDAAFLQCDDHTVGSLT